MLQSEWLCSQIEFLLVLTDWNAPSVFPIKAPGITKQAYWNMNANLNPIQRINVKPADL